MTETRVFYTSLEKDSYIRTKVKPGAEINLQDAIANTEVVLKLSKAHKFPILVDLRDIKSISKPARDHFAMRGRKPGVTAIAMVVKSMISGIIGNFFIGFSRPVVPTRIFNREDAAIAWLIRISKTEKKEPET